MPNKKLKFLQRKLKDIKSNLKPRTGSKTTLKCDNKHINTFDIIWTGGMVNNTTNVKDNINNNNNNKKDIKNNTKRMRKQSHKNNLETPTKRQRLSEEIFENPQSNKCTVDLKPKYQF